MKPCYERQNDTIVNYYNINGIDLKIEQRMITSIEYEDIKKFRRKYAPSVEVQKLIIKAEEVIEKSNLITSRLKEIEKIQSEMIDKSEVIKKKLQKKIDNIKIPKLTEEEIDLSSELTLAIETQKENENLIKCFEISKTMTFNRWMNGGYFIIDDEEIKDFNDIFEEVKLLPLNIIDELYKNLEFLKNPTEEEITEVK